MDVIAVQSFALVGPPDGIIVQAGKRYAADGPEHRALPDSFVDATGDIYDVRERVHDARSRLVIGPLMEFHDVPNARGSLPPLRGRS